MIHPDVIETLTAYWRTGRRTGDFMRAVLANDLFGAFGRADRENRATLGDIVAWIWERLPAKSYGSYEAVDMWIEQRGLEGEGGAHAQE